MAMLIVRYRDGNKPAWGRLTAEAPRSPRETLELRKLPIEAQTTAGLISALADHPQLGETGTPGHIPASQLLSPVTPDAQLICQGLNYRDHAAEAGHHVRKQNLFFTKASSSLSGPYDDIRRPEGVELLDYEIEIGIVLRRNIRGPVTITDGTVGDFVAGIVLCNDVSARDTMFGASFFQWFQ